ncbi:MAG: hypothetical protein NC041_04780 [Bacteroides sp.]|nr:hypothetical protein [Prevotella sp.]MCM1407274.1 hypothetical protein [Treponema brennaborense]MCM1469762.1 hypothetical protein [Bacteroides sp.]
MKRTLFSIIFFLISFAQYAFCQNYEAAEVSIRYYDKTLYYPGEADSNPVYIYITISNKGSETLRFKLADDRMFSVDFTARTVKNEKLPFTNSILRKRSTSRTVYFREIALESGESYSFVENLKEYLAIQEPAVYYFDLSFYPELYKNSTAGIVSNRLILDIKPAPGAAAVSALPSAGSAQTILKPDPISPDKVVEQTILARQRGMWNQFFLYFDIEQMLKNDPVRNRQYRIRSAEERQQMIKTYKSDLQQQRIENDIVAVPETFEIEQTSYSQDEGTVSVLMRFKYDTFYEKKRYTYYVRQRDSIWQIYDYTVENLGTE